MKVLEKNGQIIEGNFEEKEVKEIGKEEKEGRESKERR